FRFFASLLLMSCSRFGAVYPPRPMPSMGPPLADPPPSRVVAHLAMTSNALRAALEDAVPHSGEGTFPLLGGDRKYTWDRGPLAVSFSQGRIGLTTHIHATLGLPLHTLDFPLDLRVDCEPVVSSEYAVKLQSIDVKVKSTDTRLAMADYVGGVYEKVSTA